MILTLTFLIVSTATLNIECIMIDGGLNAKNREISSCQFDGRCTCQNFFQADCSNLKLKEMPKFPNNIIQMNLSRNNIRDIQDGAFVNNTGLLVLDLSYNNLQRLRRRSLDGLSNLTLFVVNNNNITEVANDTFSYVKMLQSINFKKNPYNSLNLNFTLVTSLANAQLDFMPDDLLHQQFWGLQNLKNLDVSGLNGNCRVESLDEDTFKFMPKLENLNISACFINNINIGTFRHLSNLTVLDVSFNRCLKCAGVENITYDMPYTSIKILKINKVHQTFELNTEVTVSNFENLYNTNLRELHLESNRIQLFERGALLKLPQTLKFLSLADNYFSFGDYFNDFHKLPMHFINLSFLFTSHDPREQPENCSNHHSICRISDINNDGQQAEISDFQVVQWTKAEYSNLGVFHVPPNMTTLIYRNCNLRYAIPTTFVSSNKIEYIDASNNIFYEWIGPIMRITELKYLDLSNNFCTNVSKVFFLNVNKLETLLVKNNLLGFVLPDDLEGEILKNAGQLRTIDLSMNRISRLPTQFFRYQKSLQTLYVNDNMFDNITFKINHMKDLSLLNISNNRLPFLHSDIRDQLEYIYKNNTYLKIDLSGNPFQCTCDHMDFVEWIATTRIPLLNMEHTYCRLENQTVVNFKSNTFLVSLLHKECSSYTTLILGTVAFIILFISILIWGLIYRYRWKIRYLYYLIKSRHQGSIKTLNTPVEKNFEYDAFVSYADKDSEFVHNDFIEKLEKEAGLHLCLHTRDFLPGNEIASNITSAVHLSRKTVVIMSQNYIESYWCMFEYNMAKMESIYTRDKENVIFLVFLEKIQPKHLPLHILELVQSQSYIEFPNDPYGDTVFWDKLCHVLSC